MLVKKIDFWTVGQLKEGLKDLPDDTPIMCQVVAVDGSAWNMGGILFPPTERVTFASIQLTHPWLNSLKGISHMFEERSPDVS